MNKFQDELQHLQERAKQRARKIQPTMPMHGRGMKRFAQPKRPSGPR